MRGHQRWITSAPRKLRENGGITQRRVEALCLNGQIHGAGRIIPKSAEKPIDGRTKASKHKNKPLEYGLTLEANRVIEMVNGTMAIESMPLTD